MVTIGLFAVLSIAAASSVSPQLSLELSPKESPQDNLRLSTDASQSSANSSQRHAQYNNQQTAEHYKVLVLGDSISAAYGMSLEQGWVAQLAARLTEISSHYTVVNASISGETTAGGLRRLPALLTKHQPQLLIVELGGNDGLRGYSTTKLRENLTQIAQLAGDADAKVLIMPMEIPPNYGTRYAQSFRNSFAEAATATGATLTPFLLDNVALEPGLMQADGIHPTAAAQPRILDNVWPHIRNALNKRSQQQSANSSD